MLPKEPMFNKIPIILICLAIPLMGSADVIKPVKKPIVEKPIVESYVTYDEMMAKINSWNTKLQTIKQNCKTDKRCIIEDGVKKVNLGAIRTRVELMDKLDSWILESDSIYAK